MARQRDQPVITKTTTTTTQLNIPANFDNSPAILNLTLSNNTTTEIIDDEDDPFKDFDDLIDGPKTITTTTISTTKEAEGKTETSTSSTTTIMCHSPRGTSPASRRMLPLSPATNIRKQLCMDNYKENDDDWDQGVDLTSFLRHKKNLAKDFNYCSNKIMEISSVQLEAQRQSVDFGGTIHPQAFQAFKEILQAKETQIKKAMKSKKIDEKDCLMLIEHLESVTEVLDKLLLGNTSDDEHGLQEPTSLNHSTGSATTTTTTTTTTTEIAV
ncbi:hypothetical protein SAMD00019534_064650 [Acytostelium subglobosum LB1]|uniref:hypothetical protein n=1 Tax=Acytostelium subglobosum LB1 TaxID=1410327 RepID=UPI000644F21E|nr:hypothetical protein SAMD00019534_064650 [Acytostelium subglobosum LB1]GAM23290.1 hypothetical protein SAMD00019534_064650 [Acytostelium subglobosum LB1]|eukprot:XP_012753739.1 hypothetical protein SAMD00019534_064650 [Acytostelium subglobosum LB1]